MKKLLPFLFFLLFIAANSTAQVTNLTINGQNSNFTLATGSPLSWSYNVPVGSATNIEFWFDTDQNGILDPAVDILWQSLIQTDGIINGSNGQNVIPDMDGIANGQVTFNISVGLAPSHYIIVFKNNNDTKTFNGIVTPLISPAFTISGHVSTPSGTTNQNIPLALDFKNNGADIFWDALTDINGDFLILMPSNIPGNPWNLSIDNQNINNSFSVSPSQYTLNITPGTSTYPNNNFTLSVPPEGLTNLNVNGSSTNFSMVSGNQLSWSYNVPVGDATAIEIWIDTDQDGQLNPASDVLWASFSQVDGVTNNQNGLPDMDAQGGSVSFQQNIGLAPAHYIFVFNNHNNRKYVTGIVNPLPSPSFNISGNVSVPDGAKKQYISMRLQNSSSNGAIFWNALTDNNGNFTIQMNSDISGNPWNLSVDNSSGQNLFNSNPRSISINMDPGITAYTGNHFDITQGSMNNKTILVNTPNGGEVWRPGENHTIYWNMYGLSSAKVEYSTDSGNSWNLIADNLPQNQCYYNWTVPSVNSQNCFIKVSDASDNSVNDISDRNFTIYQPVDYIQLPGTGQNSLNFGNTYISLDLNVLTPDQITATFYQNDAPQPGNLPDGIISCSSFYWHITTSGNIIFNNGCIKIPVAILEQIGNPYLFVWMKRSYSGDPWTNIGAAIMDGNFVSTVPFASFSEFALGTTDDALLPVELSSFMSVPNGRTIQLNWATATEKNSDRFIIERKSAGSDWGTVGSVKASVLSNSPKQYSFTDKNLQSGSYQYRLKMIDNNGTFENSKVLDALVAVPKNFELSQNFPNPFNPSTVIRYSLPIESNVIIRFYNSLGQCIREVNEGKKQTGYYDLNFNSAGLTSGIYFYRIQAGSFVATKKMMLLK
ncbi:MAG: T9SS type A sorting domain-containing protein [Ignavibacteriaceae bacterium]|nr:T9SS type A sorting domain-containing protein [Ignavibacteriaceae bacterium]